MRLAKYFCITLAILVALPVALLAQTTTGSISGVVSRSQRGRYPVGESCGHARAHRASIHH